MSIETKRKTTLQMIRFKPDTFLETDELEVKQAVEQALSTGVKDFLFSVPSCSPSKLALIGRILDWCNRAVRDRNGQLLFFEWDAGDECLFGPLCEALRIPIYRSRRNIPSKKSTVRADRQERPTRSN